MSTLTGPPAGVARGQALVETDGGSATAHCAD